MLILQHSLFWKIIIWLARSFENLYNMFVMMKKGIIKSTKEGNQRSFFLDVFRISLCCGIVFYHYTPVRPSCGSYMVNGFFVLSGFLLAMAFNRMEQLDVSRFYRAKAIRLLPLFAMGILMGFAIKLCRVIKSGNLIFDKLLPSFPPEYWGNLNPAKVAGFYDPPLWFVAVELALLLAAPLFFALYKKRGCFVAFFLLMLAVAAFLYSRVPYLSNRGMGLYYSPLCRCWQFLGGMVAARFCLAFNEIPETPKKRLVSRCLTVLFICLYMGGAVATMTLKEHSQMHCWNFTFEYDLLTVGMYMGLIPMLYSLPNKGGEKFQKTVTYIALLTYPVYVIHYLPYSIIKPFVQQGYVYYALPALAITLVLAVFLQMVQVRFEDWLKRSR